MSAINKANLVNAVASELGVSVAHAKQAVDAVLESIAVQLGKGNSVRIAGFGFFEVVKRSARTGHNPKTGEPLKIPASKQPKFRPAKKLKDSVN